MDKICPYCGKKFKGHANRVYCSPAHKRAAYLSRKKQEEETAKNRISRAELKDLNFVGNASPDAKQRLEAIYALFGVEAFRAALDACYVAVVDITS